MKKILILTFIIWNVIVCLIYGIDKLKAKHDHWRVPEKVLILLALFFGGIGAELGMQLFRHKTKHALFTIGVPVCILLNFLMIYVVIYILLYL